MGYDGVVPDIGIIQLILYKADLPIFLTVEIELEKVI